MGWWLCSTEPAQSRKKKKSWAQATGQPLGLWAGLLAMPGAIGPKMAESWSLGPGDSCYMLQEV